MHNVIRNPHTSPGRSPYVSRRSFNPSTAPPADDREYPWKQNSEYADENQNFDEPQRHDKPPEPGEDPTKSGEESEPGSYARPQPPKKRPSGIMLSVFGTRQLARNADRETYIRVTIKELIIYIFYLAVLCVICFGTISSSNYYFTRVMTKLFVENQFDPERGRSFKDSSTIADFWNFAERTLIDGIYWEFLYDSGGSSSPPPPSSSTPPPPASSSSTTTTTTTAPTTMNTTGSASSPPSSDPPTAGPKLGVLKSTQNGILFENKLIGAPRLRQIRVRPDSCEIAPNFRRLIRQCYAPYKKSIEDKTSPWMPLSIYPTAWRYYSQEQLDGSSYWGRLATYSGAGSYIDLKVDEPSGMMSAKDEAKRQISFLREKRWITRATRVIFFDFSVYNANTNLFCIVKLVWEVPATGGVLTSYHVETATLLRYRNWFDLYIIFPCEIIFCVFTLYYLLQEILEMKHEGCRVYLSDVWSWVDLTILAISFTCIGLNIYRYTISEDRLKNVNVNSAEFVSLEYLGYIHALYMGFLSVLIFIAWIKVFKYISFNKTMTQLSATLSRCAADIGGFAIMFFIVFAAFAQLGYLMFGAQVRDFSTFLDSVFTLLRLILGDFNFREIEAANRVFGPLFFIAYVFFVFFVLLNMFLAIINETFGEVKAEIQAQRNEFEIADYFKRGFNNIRGWFGKKDPKLDAKLSVKLASADGQITYDELRKNLQDAHFSDVEIEMFLARYELDRDRALDEDEIQHVLAELEGRNYSYGDGKSNRRNYNGGISEQVNFQVYQEEMESMEKRISAIESSLSLVTHKIDMMVQKLERLRG